MKRWILLLLLLHSLILWGASPGSDGVTRAFQSSYALEAQGKYRKALDVLLPLQSALKRQYGYNLRLAWLHSLLGRYKAAIRYYTKVSLILPDSFEPRLGLARVYLLRHQPSQAQISAKTVLEKDPLNYYANLYLAEALLALHQREAARHIVSTMLTYYPTSREFLPLFYRLNPRTGHPAKSSGQPGRSPASR